MEVCYVIISILVLLITWYWLKTRGDLPPGPWAPPIIGHLLAIKKEGAIKYVERLRKEYGDIFTIYLGSRPMVYFNKYSIIKDALVNKQEYCGRPVGLYAVEAPFKNRGLVLFESDHQRFLRKLTINAIYSTENGKSSVEEISQKHALAVCEEFRRHSGVPYDCKDLIFKSTASCMDVLAFGERNESEEKKFQFLLPYIKLFSDNQLGGILENYFSWLRYLRTDKKLEERLKNEDLVQEQLQERIKELRKSYNPKKIRGIVDIYIGQEDNDEDTVKDDEVGTMIMEMQLAGAETLVSAIRWGIIYMIRHRYIQLKCREEIRKELGHSRIPTPEDANRIPYTHATVKEVLRCASVAKTTLLYTAKSDFIIEGYNIPKGAILAGNLHRVLQSEEHWDGPQGFRPERWLHQGEVISREEFIPFSIGRRSCIGNKFAWTQLFCTLTSLIQNFDLRSSEEDGPPSLDYEVNVARNPVDFNLVAVPL